MSGKAAKTIKSNSSEIIRLSTSPAGDQKTRAQAASPGLEQVAQLIERSVKQAITGITGGQAHPREALQAVAGLLVAELSPDQVSLCFPTGLLGPWKEGFGRDCRCSDPGTASQRCRETAEDKGAPRVHRPLCAGRIVFGAETRPPVAPLYGRPNRAAPIPRAPKPPFHPQFVALWDRYASYPDTPILRLLLNTLAAAAERGGPDQRLLGRAGSSNAPLPAAEQQQHAAARSQQQQQQQRRRIPRPRSSGKHPQQQQQQQQQPPHPHPQQQQPQEQQAPPQSPADSDPVLVPLHPAKRQRSANGASDQQQQQQALRASTRQALKSGTHRLSSDRPLRDQQHLL
jgi:hypothetical protein